MKEKRKYGLLHKEPTIENFKTKYCEENCLESITDQTMSEILNLRVEIIRINKSTHNKIVCAVDDFWAKKRSKIDEVLKSEVEKWEKKQ